MARIHPSTPLHAPLTAGDYRERDVLRALGDGLPADFDVFHNLPWSSMHQGNQHFGEGDRRAVFVDVNGCDFADGTEGRAVLGCYGEAEED